MRSMTGFGQARQENGRHSVSLSLRAVNGRYLDLNIRAREDYRSLEPVLRELLTAELHRGRIEVNLEIRPLTPVPQVEIREDAVRALHRAFSALADEGVVERVLTPGDVLRLPGMVELHSGEASWEDEDGALLRQVVTEARDELTASRDKEGAKLAEILRERLSALGELGQEIRTSQAGVSEDAATSLRQRIEDLLGETPVDEQRLAQEIAVLADKADVREELDRLRTHLGHFRDLLAESGPLGKKLDFLAQEIFRELNTLGSKSRAGEVIQRVLDAKAIAEQIREQLQNVE